MATQTQKTLFTPVQLGPLSLKHRVVMAPLTRSRSTQPGDIPNTLMAEYYGQRASDGGLIITEATTISSTARGWFGAPGLYSDQQVEGWKKVIAAIPQQTQRQYSTVEQLMALQQAANKLGLYDAADFLKTVTDETP